MSAIAEAVPQSIPPEVQQYDHLLVEVAGEREAGADFHQVVADLQLSPELQHNETAQTLLGLAADVWNDANELPADSASKEREWVLDVILRGVGSRSGFVKEKGLSEYQIDMAQREADQKFFDRYGAAVRSVALAGEMPAILDELKVTERLSGQAMPEVPYVVVPEDDAEINDVLPGGAAAKTVPLPSGQMGIMVRGQLYEWAVEDKRPGARALLAHEAGHAMQELIIGEGTYPLNHMVNELFAEWCGNDKGSYFDEKHMANLLLATGVNIRGALIPKIASGEMALPQVMDNLKEHIGSRNTLRLLAYAPAIYEMPGREAPAAILEDCITYAKDHNGLTDEQVRDRMHTKYSPAIARIMVTSSPIRAVIPPSLYPVLLERARQDPEFNEIDLA